MKRILIFVTLLSLAPALVRLAAQEDPTATAERELAEERHRSLTKRLTDLEESFAALQKNVTALRDEVRYLKDDVDRIKNKNEGGATQESIKKLAEKIEEVDRKRAASDERNFKELEELQKAVLQKPLAGSRPAPGSANAGGTVRPTTGNPPGNSGVKQVGYKYKIRSGDTLAALVITLRKQGLNVTQAQIEKANEGVNWNRLQIGQEIFIPQP